MSNGGPLSGRALKASLSVGFLALTLLLGAVGFGLLSQSSGPDAGAEPTSTGRPPEPLPTATTSEPQATTSEPQATTSSSPQPSLGRIKVYYGLAAQQITGEVALVVNGRRAGVLRVNRNRPEAVLNVALNGPALLTYRLAGTTTFRDKDGGTVPLAARGQGIVEASPGERFTVRSERQGQAIILILTLE
ncbi:hypothetical protein [Kribbella soli]|uniref:Uncharacterized protein n=1 Tax=Kribbella soli TaxID=1124743 RepID=A0A4R0HKC8_9ACTN|nr:hypothetical protein [Kribbella soli]TCC10973.1 hypothetical protein E0H45_06670 [Kribbella soli]